MGMIGVWAMPTSEEDRLKLSGWTSVRSRGDSEGDKINLLKEQSEKSDNHLEIEMTTSVFVDV